MSSRRVVRYRRVDSGDPGGEYVTADYAAANPDTTVREVTREPADQTDTAAPAETPTEETP